MTKLALLISQMEGYGKPGAIPTRDNNPGDLRHSPHSSHSADAPDAIGQIDTVSDGWADLERQLQLYAERGLTLAQAIDAFAPPIENDTGQYLKFVCDGLGVPADTPMAQVLEVEA